MTYQGFVITIENGQWVAWDRGSLIAQGSKAYVFGVIDSLLGN